jgi:hypothetical protein
MNQLAGGSLHLISPGATIWIWAPAFGKGFGDRADWATSTAPAATNPANTTGDVCPIRMIDLHTIRRVGSTHYVMHIVQRRAARRVVRCNRVKRQRLLIVPEIEEFLD